jgi:mannose-6-phosphate isomerase-like protein (cupin superfamily)
MLRVGDRFVNPHTGASIEVVRAPGDGERGLEVLRVIKPGTGKVVPHLHADFTEGFAVERGSAAAWCRGHRRRLGPGEALRVRPSERHLNPYNAGDDDLVMRHSFDPANDFVLGYVETLCNLMLLGRTDRQGEVPLSAAFGVADATGSQTFAVGLPHVLQRSIVAPLGARLARARGYALHLPG